MDKTPAAKQSMPLGAKLWLAGFVAMFVLAGSAHFAARHVPKTVAMTSVEGIERLSGVDLPASARIINARYSAPAMSQGRTAWAVLEMPREDALALLKSEPFGDTFTREERILEGPYGVTADFFGERIEKWRPETAEQAASAHTAAWEITDDHWDAMAQADLDHPRRSVVYLQMQR
jgi:hypothetical protein